MDLFAVDRMIAGFMRRLMSDPVFRFSVIAGIGIGINAVFPDKKGKDVKGERR